MVGVSLAVGFMKTTACVYDVLTLPVQVVVQRPWRKWKTTSPWAKKIDDGPYTSYVLSDPPKSLVPDEIQTLHQLFQHIACTHRGREILGTREVFGYEQEMQKDGKMFKKLILGKYKWITMDEANEIVRKYSRSLLSLGLKPRDKIAIFAETRLEWMLIAQACFRINIGVVTLYPNLGDDGLIHGINEAHVNFIVTSESLFPKLKKIFHQLNTITHIIYMEGYESPDLTGFPESLSLISLSQLENLVDDLDPESSYEPPLPDDLAILMYTSGSTGVPKGVMITHKNIISTIRGFCCAVSAVLGSEEMYIAYLPLAHIFELSAELVNLVFGYKIGYSSPTTLTDKSTGLAKGCKGDATLLQPTVMCGVPLMLDRIRKSITEVVESKGEFSKSFFQFALKYKNFWSGKGFETPILNKIVFQKIRHLVGGKLRVILSGSAPLSPDTHEFIKSCLGVTLIQGYGMTESAGAGTAMKYDDPGTGTVGPPILTSQIRLVDWPEGNYFVADQPNPRGEIVVGGDCVTAGYYKNETLTKECYKEENGIRWFYTGDIGEMLPDGCLKIIDRKKDLVKLQHGEYVSLGKVESELKTSSIVDNICVFGNSFQNYLVALVVPSELQLRNIAKDIGKEELSFIELCQDKEITALVTKLLINYGKKCHLLKTEIPQKITLCSEEWLPDTGLVTAAFKVRRKAIEQYYQNILEAMYEKQSSNINVT